MHLAGRLLAAFIAFALTGGVASHAQRPVAPFVIQDLGPSNIPLDGTWKFRTGDDPSWSQPTLDDSNWDSIDIARPWGDQGHWSYAGHAWYRQSIRWTGTSNPPSQLGLYIPETLCTYEIYWNGKRIGSTGSMPAPTMLNVSPIQVFKLGSPQSGVLAIRASTTPLDSTTAGNGLGFAAVPNLGTLEAVQNLRAKEHVSLVRKRFLLIAQLLLYGPLFFLALLVWLHHREQKLFFWVAAFLATSTLWILADPSIFPWTTGFIAVAAIDGPTFHSLVDVSLWYLLLYLLRFDRYPALVRWTRILAWITILGALGDTVAYIFPHRDLHPQLFEILDAIATFFFSVPAIYPLVLIGLAFRKPLEPSRRLVAITAFLADMYFVVAHTSEQGERFTRWTLYNRMTRPLFTIYGVDITMPAILSLLLAASIVYAVYRYTIVQGQHQTALEQEFHNARAIQQVLVPEAVTAVSGFSIHSVYKPFGEVGGDFFQIIPLPDGGVMAVIGDVSGKGMPAAMTVALLVGTVRTLAYYERSPGKIMFAMNLRMIDRSQGGFTTCLVLRADLDGTITVANAGHLSPYVAGHEIPVEGGLALGLVRDVTYDESTFHLNTGQQLTLLTDGVIEARSTSGELLGFDRAAALTIEPAEAIAAAAQLFGQDDDITVLTLSRNA